jgi:hypothetical protein
MRRIADNALLLPEALGEEIAWFEIFDSWQANRFSQQTGEEADLLKAASASVSV